MAFKVLIDLKIKINWKRALSQGMKYTRGDWMAFDLNRVKINKRPAPEAVKCRPLPGQRLALATPMWPLTNRWVGSNWCNAKTQKCAELGGAKWEESLMKIILCVEGVSARQTWTYLIKTFNYGKCSLVHTHTHTYLHMYVNTSTFKRLGKKDFMHTAWMNQAYICTYVCIYIIFFLI